VAVGGSAMRETQNLREKRERERERERDLVGDEWRSVYWAGIGWWVGGRRSVDFWEMGSLGVDGQRWRTHSGVAGS